MGEEQDYLRACVNEPEKVLQFLCQHLDFFDHRQMIKKYINDQGVILGNKLGNRYQFLPRSVSTSATSTIDNFNEVIVINTANCLKDYHQLRTAGIKIEQVPKYTTKGLEFVISDNYDNRYMLLEERDYSEI
jgi:hypothetical protein